MKKKYLHLAILNFVLGICAICLYLPYTLEAFDMAGFEWFKFVPDMLKDNYFNVLIYFGVFLLSWVIVLNLISLFNHANLPKILFKISAILSLILPLIYVLALKSDAVLEFWIKFISKNIKIISYTLLCVSIGTFGLGLIYNIINKNRANLHLLLQALFMCALLLLLIAVNGWCGWNISKVYRLYGILVGLFAIYLPISSIILILCRKTKE